jgi:hypothetical protein
MALPIVAANLIFFRPTETPSALTSFPPPISIDENAVSADGEETEVKLADARGISICVAACRCDNQPGRFPLNGEYAMYLDLGGRFGRKADRRFPVDQNEFDLVLASLKAAVVSTNNRWARSSADCIIAQLGENPQ